MSYLDDAKALVAQHIDASKKVFDLLDQLTAAGASNAGATEAAVAAATQDLSAANDTLAQQLKASLAQLNEAYAKNGGAPAEAPAQPVL